MGEELVDEKNYSRIKGVSKAVANGSEWIQEGGHILTVVEFIRDGIFYVKFENSEIFKSSSGSFKSGVVRNKNLNYESKAIPNGSQWVQVGGSVLTVVEHLGYGKFTVKFKGSPLFKSTFKCIKNGEVRDRNLRLVCGVGYIGYGIYKAQVDNSGNTPAYEVWRGIIRRCYDPNNPSAPRYFDKGVYVAEPWHNFQNFAVWFYAEVAKMPEEYHTKFDVDKDLKGGKCYSENTCILLPYKLNNFIQNRVFSEGMGYVKKGKKNPYNKITTTVSLLGKQVYIGLHETQEDSDKSYNVAKNYVNRKMATEFLAAGLILESTANLIMRSTNDYTLEDEDVLFKQRPTLKGRIDGLFNDKNNLLERCKYRLSSEIYKELV